VYTLIQTPLFWGHDFNAGLLVFVTKLLRPFFTSCAIVGTFPPKLQNQIVFCALGKNLTTLPENFQLVKLFSGYLLRNS
jgi:hypothetical protein